MYAPIEAYSSTGNDGPPGGIAVDCHLFRSGRACGSQHMFPQTAPCLRLLSGEHTTLLYSCRYNNSERDVGSETPGCAPLLSLFLIHNMAV
jgi:hypothetical protein